VLTRYNVHGRTDRVIPIYPHPPQTLFAGGIIIAHEDIHYILVYYTLAYNGSYPFSFSSMHQQTDDNVKVTDVTMPRMRGV
jgi:hypothetical protein